MGVTRELGPDCGSNTGLTPSHGSWPRPSFVKPALVAMSSESRSVLVTLSDVVGDVLLGAVRNPSEVGCDERLSKGVSVNPECGWPCDVIWIALLTTPVACAEDCTPSI